MRVVHVAASPRNDGSQCCSRCGVELSPADEPEKWPTDSRVEITTHEEAVSKLLEGKPDDETSMCLAPSNGTVQHSAPGAV
jgi:hypothetical protein